MRFQGTFFMDPGMVLKDYIYLCIKSQNLCSYEKTFPYRILSHGING